MWIQRTLHLALPWQNAKARLLAVGEYRHACWGLEEAVTDPATGESQIRLRLPGGLEARFALRVTSETETRIAFRSPSGNVEVVGMIEFFETGPAETEAVLSLCYRFCSFPAQVWAALCRSGERFLDRNLPLVENHLQRESPGIRADRNLAKPINGQTPKPAME